MNPIGPSAPRHPADYNDHRIDRAPTSRTSPGHWLPWRHVVPFHHSHTDNASVWPGLKAPAGWHWHSGTFSTQAVQDGIQPSSLAPKLGPESKRRQIVKPSDEETTARPGKCKWRASDLRPILQRAVRCCRSKVMRRCLPWGAFRVPSPNTRRSFDQFCRQVRKMYDGSGPMHGARRRGTLNHCTSNS